MIPGRTCAWCRGPIRPEARRDAVTCSRKCRQNRHTFTTAVGLGPVGLGRPRRLAYADPPYPGKSFRYYRDHPDYAGEVDHAELMSTLATFDAWALSTSAQALPYVLSLCPPDVRVAAWFRGHRPHLNATAPLNAWEPVIYAGRIRRADPIDPSTVDDLRVDPAGSTPVEKDLLDTSTSPGADTTRRTLPARLDAFIHGVSARTSDPDRVTGAKPAAFCRWIFDLLGATTIDTLTDLYPGSGGVGRAWDLYVSTPAAARVDT